MKLTGIIAHCLFVCFLFVCLFAFVVFSFCFVLFCFFWLNSPNDSFYHLVYSVPAIISECNLRKTFRFGGRREPPTPAEIQVIVVSVSHAVGGDGG